MPHFLAPLPILALSLAMAQVAHASPTPQRAAACVAALKVRSDALAERVRAGEEQWREELTRVIEHGFAFIGDAYLDGERDEAKAKAALKAAEKAQESLSPEELAKRQAQCTTEAARLLADASALHRLIVSHAAKRRVAKVTKPTL